jgi:hypothetical protein
MIEYMLISSILEKIYEIIKKLLKYPKNNAKLNSLMHLLKIKTWET